MSLIPKPVGTYNLDTNSVDYSDTTTVWCGLADRRYKIEVFREATDKYKGNIFIYDSQNADKLIFSGETTISFGAQFGPDVLDIAQWQGLAIRVIDNLSN